MKRLIVAIVMLTAVVGSRAGLERDLGDRLSYVRIENLDTDYELMKKALTQASAIIDLRYAKAGPGSAKQLEYLLGRQETRPVRLRVYLVNSDTSPLLLAIAGKPRPRQLTVGPASPGVTVDIPVQTSGDDQRRAYAALAEGTAWEKLVNSNTEKRRFDEAALTRSHANGVAGTLGNTQDEARDEDGAAKAEEKEATPMDFVLQRAIQIHRALPTQPK
jgi:hypothetical protein